MRTEAGIQSETIALLCAKCDGVTLLSLNNPRAIAGAGQAIIDGLIAGDRLYYVSNEWVKRDSEFCHCKTED